MAFLHPFKTNIALIRNATHARLRGFLLRMRDAWLPFAYEQELWPQKGLLVSLIKGSFSHRRGDTQKWGEFMYMFKKKLNEFQGEFVRIKEDLSAGWMANV